MIELLANPNAGDGTEHPGMHLIYIEEIYYILKTKVKEAVTFIHIDQIMCTINI